MPWTLLRPLISLLCLSQYLSLSNAQSTDVRDYLSESDDRLQQLFEPRNTGQIEQCGGFLVRVENGYFVGRCYDRPNEIIHTAESEYSPSLIGNLDPEFEVGVGAAEIIDDLSAVLSALTDRSHNIAILVRRSSRTDLAQIVQTPLGESIEINAARFGSLGFGKYFMIAHEIGHVYYRHAQSDSSIRQQEDEADYFAGYLLGSTPNTQIIASSIIDVFFRGHSLSPGRGHAGRLERIRNSKRGLRDALRERWR